MLEAPQPHQNITAIAGLRIINLGKSCSTALALRRPWANIVQMLKDAFNNPIFLIALAAVVLLAYVIYVIAF